MAEFLAVCVRSRRNIAVCGGPGAPTDLLLGALASLFEPDATRLELTALPTSHRSGPDYLNVLKFLDVPQALAMAAERGTVTLRNSDRTVGDYTRETMRQLGWSRERLKVE